MKSLCNSLAKRRENEEMPVFDTIVSALNQRRLIFFVGSGISSDFPSCLPIGNTLSRGIIGALGAHEGDSKQIADSMTLERVLWMIYPTLFKDTNQAYNVVDTSQENDPRTFNLNLYLLANFLIKGKTKAIFTTNQDTLLEEALKFVSKNNFEIIVSKDDYELFDPQIDERYLFKLHGSIDNPDSLTVMLPETSSFPDYKSKIMEHYFSNRYIKLFLGYGGNDIDIWQFIKKDSGNIIWVLHPGSSPNSRVESLKNKIEANATDLLLALTINGIDLNPYECKLAQVKETFNSCGDLKDLVKNILSAWADSLSKEKRLLALGILYKSLWKGDEAIPLFNKALEIADKNKNYVLSAEILCERARAYEALNDYKHQEKDLLESFEIARKANKRICQLRALHGLAESFQIRDDPKSMKVAFRYILNSLKLLKELEKSNTATEKSRMYLEWEKRHILFGYGQILMKMARFSRKDTNNFNYLLTKSIEILKDIENSYKEDRDFLTEISFVYAKALILKNETEEAKKIVEGALKDSEWIGKPHSIEQSLKILSRINLKQRNFKEAEKLIFKALKLDKEELYSEPLLAGRNYLTLSLINYYKKDYLKMIHNGLYKGVYKIYYKKMGLKGIHRAYYYLLNVKKDYAPRWQFWG